MFVKGEWSFYTMRFLLGIAEAGFLPGIIYYLSQWFPREQRAKAVSWFMIGIPLSVVFGGPLSGWLLGFDGHWGCAAGSGCTSSKVCPRGCSASSCSDSWTDKPADAKWLAPEQRQWLAERIQAEHVDA